MIWDNAHQHRACNDFAMAEVKKRRGRGTHGGSRLRTGCCVFASYFCALCSPPAPCRRGSAPTLVRTRAGDPADTAPNRQAAIPRPSAAPALASLHSRRRLFTDSDGCCFTDAVGAERGAGAARGRASADWAVGAAGWVISTCSRRWRTQTQACASTTCMCSLFK